MSNSGWAIVVGMILFGVWMMTGIKHKLFPTQAPKTKKCKCKSCGCKKNL
jgi:hypothetical protein